MKMRSLYINLATGFGIGRYSRMPGTWGTLLALPIYFLLSESPKAHYLIVIFLLYSIGVYLCTYASIELKEKDPGIVVYDEVVGFLVALYFVPHEWLLVFVAYVTFRFFDIAKPFPIPYIEKRLGTGHAIMLDDVIAGLYTSLIIHFLFIPFIGQF